MFDLDHMEMLVLILTCLLLMMRIPELVVESLHLQLAKNNSKRGTQLSSSCAMRKLNSKTLVQK